MTNMGALLSLELFCLAFVHTDGYFSKIPPAAAQTGHFPQNGTFFKTELFFALRSKNVRLGREPIFQLHAALCVGPPLQLSLGLHPPT